MSTERGAATDEQGYTITVDGAALTNAGAALRRGADDMATDCAALLEEIAPLLKGFRGTFAEAFTTKLDDAGTRITTLLDRLGQLGDMLSEYAAAADDTDNALAAMFRGRAPVAGQRTQAHGQ